VRIQLTNLKVVFPCGHVRPVGESYCMEQVENTGISHADFISCGSEFNDMPAFLRMLKAWESDKTVAEQLDDLKETFTKLKRLVEEARDD